MSLGTFTKDGLTKVAETPADVVRLRFDGWKLQVADDAAPTPPPHSGRGSGRDAWVQYATDHGVEVDDEMSREDIVAALAALHVPTD